MTIRIVELLRPLAGSWSSVIDAGGGDIDVEAFVTLPGLAVMRLDPRGPGDAGVDAAETGAVGPDGRTLDDRALVVVTAGPDQRFHGDLAAAVSVIERVAPGGSVLVMLGWPAADLRADELAQALAGVGLDPEQVVGTPYARVPMAVLARRTRSVGAADSIDDEAVLAFEQAFAQVAAERLAEEVTELKARLTARGDDADPLVRVAELTRERAELAASLRQAQGQLRSAERKVTSLEASTSMRVGRALIGAAKNPRAGMKLPREAYRMWRMRGGRAGVAKARGSASSAQDPSGAGEVRRLVAWRGSSLEPRDRLSLAGVLRPATAATLGRHAFVSTTTPDDAAAVIERTDPDLVLIETAAGGSVAGGSPWAYLGDPAATERERRLLRLAEAAQAAGRPVVLWRNTPVHLTAALDDFAARCDLVVDSAPARSGGTPWSIGISLAEAVDLGVRADQRSAVLYAGGYDPRETAPRRAQLVEALRAAGENLVIRPRRGGAGVEGLPDDLQRFVGRELRDDEYLAACRDAAVVLACPFVVARSTLGLRDDDLLALAAGARLVSGANHDLAALSGLDHVVTVIEGLSPTSAVHSAMAAGPIAGADLTATLRTLFLQHAVPARLRELVDLVGVRADVDVDRRIAVVAVPGSPIDASALVEAIASQVHRPSEVVVLRTHLPSDRALDELTAMGVRTVMRGDDAGLHEMAWSVDAHWLAMWDPAQTSVWNPTHLLDLAIGAEAAKADAVGIGARAGIEAVDSLEGASVLLRRELVLADAQSRFDPHRWSRSGRKLVAVGTGAPA